MLTEYERRADDLPPPETTEGPIFGMVTFIIWVGGWGGWGMLGGARARGLVGSGRATRATPAYNRAHVRGERGCVWALPFLGTQPYTNRRAARDLRAPLWRYEASVVQ